MTLAELIRRFRVLSRDTVDKPYLFSKEDITMWLNDAAREAAIRARLIRDSVTAGVAKIDYTLDKQVYELHPSVFEIIAIRRWRPDGKRGHPIYLRSPEWMDRNVCHWRTDPLRYRHDNFAIQNDRTIELVTEYEAGDVIWLDCYRTPLGPMRGDGDEPEFHEMHHEYLVQWALHRAFSVPDADMFDSERSKDAEKEFTKYFGIRPDADARRSTREDDVQHNYPVLL